jgi:hypothetical protein
MNVVCEGCHEELQPGQLYTGLAVTPTESIHGHYRCVLDLLDARDPKFVVRALQKGLLPNIDPDTLEDGKLPKFCVERPKPAFLLDHGEVNLSEDLEEEGTR